MRVGTTATGLVVRLDPGDDVVAQIQAAAAAHHIANAEVTGLGSVEAPTLAHYRRDTQKFTERAFAGIFEVVSLVGNISLVDDRPTLHCHVTISDADMTTHGGHLVHATCSATLELIIRRLDTSYAKRHDDTVGLNIWQLPAA
jgi:predicted DNA-binding protein with PD1-like motif